jgi:hypothetical protein
MPFDAWPEYEICYDGTIKSRERYVEGITKLGKPFRRLVKARILKPRKTKKGHLFVSLWRNNEEFTKYVHRLVAEKYIPNPHNYPCVLHSDDDPTNNRVDNLRWGTYQDNVDDMVCRGRNAIFKGSENKRAKITEKDVPEIKRLYKQGLSQKEIGERFGLARTTIGSIVRSVNWKHVR